MTLRYPLPMLASWLLLVCLGCSPSTPTDAGSSPPPPPPPPAPAPVPLTLAVNPASRKASAQPGSAAPGDNATITLAGDNAATATWIASKRQGWTTFTSAAGTGSGTVSWSRSTTGLAPGTYVDTITVTATGAAGSPATLIDTLLVTTAPVPLTLVVAPHSRSASVAQGSAAPDDNAAVTLTGDGASTTTWFVTGAKTWTSLVNGGGTGSGSLAWHRNAAGLAVGVYIDTLTITANGATGSPIGVIDTLRVTQPPVPLTLAVSPASRNVTIAQGGSAAATTATVTLAGDNSATTAWTATKKKSWTTLTTAAGTGSGSVAWSRATTALTAGTYVDTISVTATGASGSPATVIDTIIVTAPAGGGPTPDLGINTSLHGKQVLPLSDPWNQPVDTAQLDPSSDAILQQIGLGKSLHPDFGSDPSGTFGYSYAIVADNTPRYPVAFDYASQSDPGPYPIPANPPIEQGSDGHLLVITQNEWKLYEMFAVHTTTAPWSAGSGAIFDLINGTQRPQYWTSADAAGLPMFPGLVRYDEVYEQGAINHALRFTVTNSRHAFVPPATHFAASSTDPTRAPMGMRVRLKASVDISSYPAPMQVILKALKKYGMMVADNGGDFFLSGATDLRWDNDMNNLLKQVHVGDFQVVTMTGIVTQ